MFLNNVQCLTTIGIALVCIVPTVASADEQPPKFEFVLSLGESVIVEKEPVVAQVRVVNLTEQPQSILGAMDPQWRYMRFRITAPDSNIYPYRPSGVADGVPGTREIASQGSLGHRKILYYTHRRYWFGKPGEYRLRASFQHAIADEFEHIIREYPNSNYAPWCYYILGWSWQARDSVSKKMRAQMARRYYGKLLEKYPEFPLKQEVRYEMARELLRLGKREEAWRKLEKIIQKEQDDLLLFHGVRREIEHRRKLGEKITADTLHAH